MFGKNPYENEDSIEIQDFSNDDDDGKVNESFLEADEELEEVEEYEKKEPVYRRVKQEVIIVTGALLAVLLVLAIIALVYGANKNKAYNDLKADYDAYISKTTATETDLKNQISDLQKKLTEATTPKVEEIPAEGANYKVVADSVRVRNGVGTDVYANYNALPEDVKAVCDQAGEEVIIYKGSVVKVLETKSENAQRVWGRIADNAWIPLSYDGNEWCAKQ